MSAATKIKDTAKELSNAELAKKIQDSANQIWLAGLGAFSTAQEESGKVFESLVKQGQEFENKTSSNVRKQIKLAETRVQGIRNKANDSLDKLEQIFEERVTNVLKNLGVPTYEDIEQLKAQLEELRASIPEQKKRLIKRGA